MLDKWSKNTEPALAQRVLHFLGLDRSRDEADPTPKQRAPNEPEERKHQFATWYIFAAFLGVLLFGRKLVPPWAHFIAALMVALGTLFSTFWIIATNSWMQTPAGYEIVDGRFLPKDWLQIIFSPSFPYRLAHVVDAVYITTGFVVVGVAASYLRQGRFVAEARTMLSMSSWVCTR